MRLLLVAFALLAGSSTSAQTGTITGTIRDAETGDALIGASVRVEGTALGAATDIDGHFRIAGVRAGAHALMATYVGYTPMAVTDVPVIAGQTLALSFVLSIDPTLWSIDICCEGEPIVDRSPFASRVIFADDLERMPVIR